ncbi:hypothetical protein [Mycobacterium sp. AT1]|uniref:hypothetical protein n=1 Tax=Mycobacterium sp. AT1 TaxID=1961706 RepID=UPI001301FC2F|nr:hypothetical protein [Mycobacterium sp. AT1]
MSGGSTHALCGWVLLLAAVPSATRTTTRLMASGPTVVDDGNHRPGSDVAV